MSEEGPKHRGLQVAGPHGAAATEERYRRAFLLEKIASRGGGHSRATPASQGDELCDDGNPEPEPQAKPSMRAILGLGGVIARNLPGYEPREAQLAMAETVAAALERGEHCLCEAGTGTGKSLAYLIPAIYAGKKTVISTAVKSMQEQLARKDIPFLQAVLPVPFTAAVLKGRSNFLCSERYNQELGEQEMFGEAYEIAGVQKWLQGTETGDLEELPFGLSPELRARLTATSEQCLGKHCPSLGACFVEAARERAEAAQVVIVNHTLLSLDCAIRRNSDNKAAIIPDRDLVIVDEAHRLEEAATRAFETEVSALGIAHLLHDRQVHEAALDPLKLARVQDGAEAFFHTLSKLRPSPQFSLGEPPRGLQLDAENLSLRLLDLKRELERANPYAQEGGVKAEAYARFLDRVDAYAKAIADILFPTQGQIVYVSKEQGKKRQTTYLRKCPISVAAELGASLWQKWPVVATSATLATGGTFDYFKGRVGCEKARELIVDSPFDYRRNALVYLPPSGTLFDPTRYYQEGSIEYFDRLAEQLEALLLASDGRAFCLFTSRKALEEVHGRIAHRLRWLVLRQGEAPTSELLRRFKEDGHAVLFALRSFFEGVDIQGEALSLVTIDKLPFNAPDDPVYEARCRQLTQVTGETWAWFKELALPTAIITIKQGCGRLIRTKSDWGVVALLDGRLTTKNYGTTVLRSLPPAAQTRSLEAVRAFFASRQVAEPQQGSLF